jgi:hypothetical protein
MIQPKYVHIPMVLRFPKGFSLPGPAFPAYTAWGSHHLEGDTKQLKSLILKIAHLVH